MKKKWLIIFLLISVLAIATACNDGHTHNFSDEWTNDTTYHWHSCDGCDKVKDKAAHNYGNDNTCDDCGYSKLSEGLEYEYDNESESYLVTGMGECNDTISLFPNLITINP